MLGWACSDGGMSVHYSKASDLSNDDHTVSSIHIFSCIIQNQDFVYTDMNLFLSVGSLLLELDNLTISIFVQKNYNSRISDGLGWSTFVYILGFLLLIYTIVYTTV